MDRDSCGWSVDHHLSRSGTGYDSADYRGSVDDHFDETSNPDGSGWLDHALQRDRNIRYGAGLRSRGRLLPISGGTLSRRVGWWTNNRRRRFRDAGTCWSRIDCECWHSGVWHWDDDLCGIRKISRSGDRNFFWPDCLPVCGPDADAGHFTVSGSLRLLAQCVPRHVPQ